MQQTVPAIVGLTAGSSLVGLSAVAMTAGYNLCYALDPTGAVHAWGDNAAAGLGVASATYPTSAVPLKPTMASPVCALSHYPFYYGTAYQATPIGATGTLYLNGGSRCARTATGT